MNDDYVFDIFNLVVLNLSQGANKEPEFKKFIKNWMIKELLEKKVILIDI